MVLSDCKDEFGNYIDMERYVFSPNLSDGQTYNIPDSTYSIIQMGIYCAPDVVSSTSTIRVYKAGILIGETTYLFGNIIPFLLDNKNLCISLYGMACGLTPPEVNYNIWYNPCVPYWQCEIPLNGYESDGCGYRRYNPACVPPTATHMIEYKVHESTPTILLNMVDYMTPLVNYLKNIFPAETWGYAFYSMTVLPNEKKIQVYLTKIGSVDLITIALEILMLVLAAIVAVLSALYFGAGLILYVILIAAVLLMSYAIYDLIQNQIIGRDDAVTNLTNQNIAEKRLDDRIKLCYDTYNASLKTKDDCIKLIDCLYESYFGYIETMRNYFPNINVDVQKQDLKTKYDDIRNKFINDIIDCATAISLMTSAGTTSKTETTTIVYNTYNMGEKYVPPPYPTCDQFSTKEECEKAGCMWKDGICVRKEEECWIRNPLGGCLLTKKTAMTIGIIAGFCIGGYVIFKVATK